MKYADDARYLWKTHVPKRGQADTVQGELMRAVAKLRWEAQNNGNGNWDDENDGSVNQNFIRFCDYLEQTLAVTPPFDEAAVREIRADITRLRDFLQPYLEDDLYDRLDDRIVEFHRHLGRIVPREHDPLQNH
jgi:hypothetical protein